MKLGNLRSTTFLAGIAAAGIAGAAMFAPTQPAHAAGAMAAAPGAGAYAAGPARATEVQYRRGRGDFQRRGYYQRRGEFQRRGGWALGGLATGALLGAPLVGLGVGLGAGAATAPGAYAYSDPYYGYQAYGYAPGHAGVDAYAMADMQNPYTNYYSFNPEIRRQQIEADAHNMHAPH